MHVVIVWGPVLLWVYVILQWASTPHLRVLKVLHRWLGSLPWTSAQNWVVFLDSRAGEHLLRKSAHVAVYFVLGLLLFRALTLSWPLSGLEIGIITLGLGLVVAVGDEFILQAQTTGRHPSLGDVSLDMLGMGLAVLFYWLWCVQR